MIPKPEPRKPPEPGPGPGPGPRRRRKKPKYPRAIRVVPGGTLGRFGPRDNAGIRVDLDESLGLNLYRVTANDDGSVLVAINAGPHQSQFKKDQEIDAFITQLALMALAHGAVEYHTEPAFVSMFSF